MNKHFSSDYLSDRQHAKQRFDTAFIPLKEAYICVNCDAIFKSQIHVCPTCSSTTGLSLAKILNRKETLVICPNT